MFQSLWNRNQAGSATAASQIAQMSTAELKQRLEAGEELVMVDVRSADEYTHDGHIADSRLMPLPTLAHQLQDLPKDQLIVCVCRSGNRSQIAAEMLARQGFSRLANLRGGMIGWRNAGLPTE
jgi:rhodanese-related sulfurtransferase